VKAPIGGTDNVPGAARPAAGEAGRKTAGAWIRVLIGSAVVALSGCSKPPPAPPLATVYSLQISATGDANPTPQGQGAPVAIRVYQLSARSAFEGAEFYQLYHADAATLGADLVKKDEFLLIPITDRSFTVTPDASVHAIGVFAAYADFQHAVWRATADLPAHQMTKITVTADRSGLKLASQSDKPASP